ncbi:hypothetical protein [Winogradskyella sp.]|uniref:hypothetical protein n=1 Tax=Winogradskyella sp. TaxID=1883156 RepID=UPI001B22E90D|nr:hypothetical protein [Winogradskyella sp.]MBO6879432.1 hypothetical protein [Winogradskyella sp.]
MQFTYAIGFRTSDHLQTFNVNELNSNMWWFQDNIVSWQTSKPIGAYRLISFVEANKEFNSSHWPINSNCPLVGKTLGFIIFNPWCDNEMEKFFIEEMLRFGLGFVVKIGTNLFHDLVQKKECTLYNITNKHGFGEGGEYLTGASGYHIYIRNCIAEMLIPLKLEPYSYHGGDHEHILDGFLNEKAGDWQLFYKHQHTIKKHIWLAESIPENFFNRLK